MKAFLQAAENQWGMQFVPGQLMEVRLADTPDPEPYYDEEQMKETFQSLEEETTIQLHCVFNLSNTYHLILCIKNQQTQNHMK